MKTTGLGNYELQHIIVLTMQYVVYVFYQIIYVVQWMWCIFSTSLPSLDGAIAIVHTPYNPWCFTDLWRYTEAAGYASHSHETIFATSFKTAFLEQLLLGKARHKSKCKLIHTAIILNIAQYYVKHYYTPHLFMWKKWEWRKEQKMCKMSLLI